MDGLHGASRKWILLGWRLHVLRVNLASQAVTARIAVRINPLRHPIPIIRVLGAQLYMDQLLPEKSPDRFLNQPHFW